MSLLPADIYTVINKTLLTNEDKNNLIALYEPIIGSSATSLYLTLWSDLDKLQIQSKDYTHHHLMCLMKLDLNTLKKAREALESVGLLKTYYKEGEVVSYVYELYSPIPPKEFFNHPILNVVLYNNLGKKEYENIISLYQNINFNLEGYEDITKSINDTFVSSTEVPEFSIKDKEYQSINAKNVIDFDILINSIPKNIIDAKALNKRMKELINNLSFIYNLDTLKMTEILRSTLNEKGFIDAKELRKKTKEYYTYINNGKLPTLVYRSQPEYLKKPSGDSSEIAKEIYTFENTTPYDYLKKKYKGVPPTSRDLKLIEDLIVDLKLTPAVVNVLIEHVLKNNDNKLNRAYVETVAGQWKRSGVETAEEAMILASKESKKITIVNKTKQKEKIVPSWYKKEIKEERLSEEKIKELEELMKGLD